mmetsp:Transcript_31932/g.101648  ORF Transcript_31932/g.101648 Transcript_31932/m.101648 type:complete len:578 (-) Transcript_31932:946-2679(-)
MGNRQSSGGAAALLVPGGARAAHRRAKELQHATFGGEKYEYSDFLLELFSPLLSEEERKLIMGPEEFWKLITSVKHVLCLHDEEIEYLKKHLPAAADDDEDEHGDGDNASMMASMRWRVFVDHAPELLSQYYNDRRKDVHLSKLWVKLHLDDGAPYWYNKKSMNCASKRPKEVLPTVDAAIVNAIGSAFIMADKEDNGMMKMSEFKNLFEETSLGYKAEYPGQLNITMQEIEFITEQATLAHAETVSSAVNGSMADERSERRGKRPRSHSQKWRGPGRSTKRNLDHTSARFSRDDFSLEDPDVDYVDTFSRIGVILARYWATRAPEAASTLKDLGDRGTAAHDGAHHAAIAKQWLKVEFDGSMFYYNKRTRQSTWERPTELVPSFEYSLYQLLIEQDDEDDEDTNYSDSFGNRNDNKSVKSSKEVKRLFYDRLPKAGFSEDEINALWLHAKQRSRNHCVDIYSFCRLAGRELQNFIDKYDLYLEDAGQEREQWVTFWTPQRQPYFYHKNTGMPQWDTPEALRPGLKDFLVETMLPVFEALQPEQPDGGRPSKAAKAKVKRKEMNWDADDADDADDAA